MLGKIRLGLLAGAALASSVAFGTVRPADAAPEACVVLAQPANISPGLYYPVTDPRFTTYPTTGPNFSWVLNGTCANNGAHFESSGTAYGWCGRSVGTGTGRIVETGQTYTIEWQSVGSQLILTHPSARGSVNAQANPPGSPNGSCTNGTATTFLVDGSIVTGL